MRTLLIAVLVIVLPVKGMAAAGVVPCGMISPQGLQSQPAHLVHEAQGAHGLHGPHGAHGWHGAPEALPGNDAPGPVEAADLEPRHPQAVAEASTHPTCKHCAPCSLAAAPPEGVGVLPASSWMVLALPASAVSWRSATLLLPERPPRPFLV